jgi:hypothetical protein
MSHDPPGQSAFAAQKQMPVLHFPLPQPPTVSVHVPKYSAEQQ